MLELTRLTSVLYLSSVEDVIQIFCSGDRVIEKCGLIYRLAGSWTRHVLLRLSWRGEILSRLLSHGIELLKYQM